MQQGRSHNYAADLAGLATLMAGLVEAAGTAVSALAGLAGGGSVGVVGVWDGRGSVSDSGIPSCMTHGGASPLLGTAITGIPTARSMVIPILEIPIKMTIRIRLRSKTTIKSLQMETGSRRTGQAQRFRPMPRIWPFRFSFT